MATIPSVYTISSSKPNEAERGGSDLGERASQKKVSLQKDGVKKKYRCRKGVGGKSKKITNAERANAREGTFSFLLQSTPSKWKKS